MSKLRLLIALIVFLYRLIVFGQSPDVGKNQNLLSATILQKESDDKSYTEYFFYDDSGTLVKKLRNDEFESRNPVFKLDFPKSNDANNRWLFFDYLTSYSVTDGKLELVPLVSLEKKLAEFSILERYGLHVKSPEKATAILGKPQGRSNRPIISGEKRNYVIKIENAAIIDEFASEIEGSSNALLDCSQISVYDHLGKLRNEILIPDKKVFWASLSNDGNYMICICEYSYVWDEGVSNYQEGIMVINLQDLSMNYISTYETKKMRVETSGILYADGYFQLTYGNPWSGGKCHLVYIDPVHRRYYTKTYPEDYSGNRKAIRVKSFMQFEGIKEVLSEFEHYTY